jgi:hypothetical protein
MVDLVCGRQPYRGLRRRLLGTGEIGWAAGLAAFELGRRLRRGPAPGGGSSGQ